MVSNLTGGRDADKSPGIGVSGDWSLRGLEKGIAIAYTYDEKDFSRIEGLVVKKP
jgi:hypothetical protein